MAALLPELEAAWARSDLIFSLLRDDALFARPIPLRHPFVFYLGHLPAFAWNQLCKPDLECESPVPAFDDLFERGIDPPTDAAPAADDACASWPPLAEVLAYRDAVRDVTRALLGGDPSRPDARRGVSTASRAAAVLEHELMHHETLLYMLRQLEHDRKQPPAALPTPQHEPAATTGTIEIPAGTVTQGVAVTDVPFAWDNEHPAREVAVDAFRIDSLPVTNRDFLEFVEAGGYDDARHWGRAAWEWKSTQRMSHPVSWRRAGPDGACVAMFADVPLADVLDRPVSVSGAEARAYASWRGARLPTEPELLRAAYADPDGSTRSWPWGETPPAARHGNFGFESWEPVPVGSHPAGASAFGVLELVGNGWEWTSTRFERHRGFSVTLPSYPGYSADFFEDAHDVLLGASWVTDRRLVRRSFRNWFRPHYPYVFSKFRCVEAA